jgi:hypothetical protein
MGTEEGIELLEFPDEEEDEVVARVGEVGAVGVCPPPWVCPQTETEKRTNQESRMVRQRVNIVTPAPTGDCNP